MSILAFLFTHLAIAAPVVIGVIDTGYSPIAGSVPICAHIPSYNSATDKPLKLPNDLDNRHGTMMTQIIYTEARGPKVEDVPMCFVIVKYLEDNISDKDRTISIRRSFRYFLDKKVDIISYSSAGGPRDRIEEMLFKRLLDKGVMINVAAGNHGETITEQNPVYPAMYDARINVIGAKDLSVSNRGDVVDYYERGLNVCTIEGCSTGTSPATAVFTGKQIKALYEKKNNR